MSAAIRSIIVAWVDDACMRELATARGWTEESEASWLDLVGQDECEKTRDGFSSVTKAKRWATQHRTLDLFRQPEIFVYEWPNERRLSCERETVKTLRYIGDGLGWDDMQ